MAQINVGNTNIKKAFVGTIPLKYVYVGNVLVADFTQPTTLWLLQPKDAPDYFPYKWIDSETWDDNLYWIDGGGKSNIFRAKDIVGDISTVLKGDYKLKDTDVLYD